MIATRNGSTSGASPTRHWLSVCAAIAGGAHWALSGDPAGLGGAGLNWPHPMIGLAMLSLALGSRNMGAATGGRWDGLLFATALLACMAPFRTSSVVSLICAGILSLRAGGAGGRTGGVLLFALAGWGLKDAVWAGFASVPLLWFETQATAALLNIGGIGAEASGNRIFLADGTSFLMLRACSVLALAYPCAVGVYALSRLLRPLEAPGWRRILAALALLTLLNLARLVGMASSPAIYDFLHNDSGRLPLQLAWAGVVMIASAPGGWRR